jgi:long-chain acyl-CoA synthetase
VCDEEHLAGIFYTGGTTGAAKGVMLSHGNLLSNALHLAIVRRFGTTTRWLVAAPMFHAAGTIAVLATIWHGGQHVILPTFDGDAALDLVEQHRVTDTLVVPTMLAAITAAQTTRPRDTSTLELIAHGGAPAATSTLKAAHQAFPTAEMLHIYGATETSPIATLLPHEERLLDAPRSRSCGQPAVGVEVEVRGDDGPADPGDVGELYVRGPNVMLGYWRKEEATKEALSGGWYRTGDLGYQDEAGFIFLVDRAKDMIVTGGENVYSVEVEEALSRHPAVLEVAVFGVPDVRWGEAVHAIVVHHSEVSASELSAHCRTLIAGFKVPKTIELREAPLPKSGAGKILKRELREPFWASAADRVAGA